MKNLYQRVGPICTAHARCRFFLFLLLLAVQLTADAQRKATRLRIMSYNVENLFDTQHDTLKNDYEFLSESKYRWTPYRYNAKLNGIARVIVAAGEGEVPALVGLCEVENDSVLTDLTQHSLLRAAGYRYLMTASPDQRGIDVALLYQPVRFRPLTWQSIRIPPLTKHKRATRDILHVCGRLTDKSLLDVFVCHLPSRSGGQKESEPYRILAAQTLRNAVDSIAQVREDAQIVIMGDFNDYPDNRSLTEVLGARLSVDGKRADKDSLYNLTGMAAHDSKDIGSYRYRGQWGMLDHIIVNGRLLRRNRRCRADASSATIFSPDFLLEEDTANGGKKPFRTYYGPMYHGGYSDHLPVYIDLYVRY